MRFGCKENIVTLLLNVLHGETVLALRGFWDFYYFTHNQPDLPLHNISDQL